MSFSDSESDYASRSESDDGDEDYEPVQESSDDDDKTDDADDAAVSDDGTDGEEEEEEEEEEEYEDDEEEYASETTDLPTTADASTTTTLRKPSRTDDNREPAAAEAETDEDEAVPECGVCGAHIRNLYKASFDISDTPLLACSSCATPEDESTFPIVQYAPPSACTTADASPTVVLRRKKIEYGRRGMPCELGLMDPGEPDCERITDCIEGYYNPETHEYEWHAACPSCHVKCVAELGLETATANKHAGRLIMFRLGKRDDETLYDAYGPECAWCDEKCVVGAGPLFVGQFPKKVRGKKRTAAVLPEDGEFRAVCTKCSERWRNGRMDGALCEAVDVADEREPADSGRVLRRCHIAHCTATTACVVATEFETAWRFRPTCPRCYHKIFSANDPSTLCALKLVHGRRTLDVVSPNIADEDDRCPVKRSCDQRNREHSEQEESDSGDTMSPPSCKKRHTNAK